MKCKNATAKQKGCWETSGLGSSFGVSLFSGVWTLGLAPEAYLLPSRGALLPRVPRCISRPFLTQSLGCSFSSHPPPPALCSSASFVVSPPCCSHFLLFLASGSVSVRISFILHLIRFLFFPLSRLPFRQLGNDSVISLGLAPRCLPPACTSWLHV